MIEQETVEKPVDEKSMAKLAEIWSELGVNIIHIQEQVDDDTPLSVITFRGDNEYRVFQLADIAEVNGYKVFGVKAYWDYSLGYRQRPSWEMAFSTC